MNIIETMADPALFGRHFRDLATWRAWLVILRAIFGLPMDGGEQDVFRKLTGRTTPLSKAVDEAYFIIGRRGGKSLIVALIGVFAAFFKDWTPYLAPGERGTVMILACDRKQARVIFRYIVGFIEAVPMLARLVERQTAEEIDLSNRITIEVHAANFRSVRGYTIVCALCDELAFWRDESSTNPDREIVDAIRPAMATVPGALLIGLGTPYRRSGVLWEAWRDHYGNDDSTVLVVQADTRTMNPTVPQSVIDRAYERDAISAAAEYGAEFRRDIEAFISPEAVEACVVPGRRELPPTSDFQYVAFTDPSGGSQDSMTLAIAHAEGERRVLDAVREITPPFSPDAVVAEFAGLLERYGLTTVSGDRYGGEWPRERFRTHGIDYEVSDRAKSDLYREFLPLLNSGEVELLDNDRLLAQLAGLERRTARGGRDSIDHAPRAHDDVANAAAGAVWLAAQSNQLVIAPVWSLKKESLFTDRRW